MGFFDRLKKIRPAKGKGETPPEHEPPDEQTAQAGMAPEADSPIPLSGFDDRRQEMGRGGHPSVPQPLREEASAYFQRGNAYFKLENYERAIQDYSRAIAVFPEYIEAYYNRAIAYKNIQDHLRAIDDYSRIIEIAPNFVAAYTGRAALYAALNDQFSAMEDMKIAARLGSQEIQDLLKAKGIDW